MPGRAGQGGFTLLETAVAGALLTLFLSSLFLLNSTVLRMLRSGTETVAASQVLQARVEQFRLANWLQVTNPDFAKLTLSKPTDADTDLPGLTEAVSAAPYQVGSGVEATAFSFERTGTAITTRGGSGVDLTGRSLVQINVSVRWSSWGGRARARSLCTVVSKWGISK